MGRYAAGPFARDDAKLTASDQLKSFLLHSGKLMSCWNTVDFVRRETVAGAGVKKMYTYINTHKHTHTYIHIHTHTHTHTHIHTHTHTYIHIHTYTHTYIIHTYTHTYIHTQIHTCTHIHTYTYTHT